MEMCYSVSSCVDRVASRCVVDLCALFLVWCGWLVVDRAVEPVERVTCLNVAIASSSRHGRSAKHVPSLVLSLFLCYLLEDRAFELVRGMVVRSTISIVGSSRRDRDAEHNSFPVFS